VRDQRTLLVVIAVGGALGSLGRWAVSTVVGRVVGHGAGQMAWATWAENLSGAFLLGMLIVTVFQVRGSSRYLRPFLAVGVLGGYTTFSTYMLDTRDLLAAGHLPTALGYLLGTLLGGLAAVWAGLGAGRGLVAARMRRRNGLGG